MKIYKLKLNKNEINELEIILLGELVNIIKRKNEMAENTDIDENDKKIALMNCERHYKKTEKLLHYVVFLKRKYEK